MVVVAVVDELGEGVTNSRVAIVAVVAEDVVAAIAVAAEPKAAAVAVEYAAAAERRVEEIGEGS